MSNSMKSAFPAAPLALAAPLSDSIAAIDAEQPVRKHELCCPHCKSPGNRRSSREVTITFREIFYVCRNPVCGHTWKASLTYDYGLSPSAIPDPAVNLPVRVADRKTVVTALVAARSPGSAAKAALER